MGERYIDQYEAYMLIKHEAETHELPASKEAYERASRIVAQLRPVNVAIMVQKTGRWIANDEYDGEVYYICSRCEAPWVTIDGTPQENGMKYCPHCGAKMEGETE